MKIYKNLSNICKKPYIESKMKILFNDKDIYLNYFNINIIMYAFLM